MPNKQSRSIASTLNMSMWSYGALALASSPVKAQDVIPPKVYTTTPTFVNLADGSFIMSEDDLKIGPLTLTRRHLGGQKDPNDPPFGPRMTSDFHIFVDMHVKPENRSIALSRRYKPIVNLGSSSSGIFEQDITPAGGPYWSSDESRKGILELVSGSYRYTAQDGTIYDFTPSVHIWNNGVENQYSQSILKVTSPNGGEKLFSYDTNQRLTLVSSNYGFAIAFEYNSTGKVSAACGYNMSKIYVYNGMGCRSALLRTTYSYNSDNTISGFTDSLGRTTSYGYQGDEISCITPPGYSDCKIKNRYSGGTPAFQVVSQTLSDGSVWNYQYTGVGIATGTTTEIDNYSWDEPYNSTIITDPSGKVATASFDLSTPYSYTDANGRTTQYRYWGGFEPEAQLIRSQDENDPGTINPNMSEGEFLISSTSPEGNSYKAEYNGPFLAISRQTEIEKSGNQATSRTITYDYSSACIYALKPSGDCPKPISIKDAKGNQTDYTYASHGGLLSEMKPAPSSGAARPLKLTSWAQRYAWIKNSSGSLVQASSPIWMKTSEVECQTTAGSNTATCDASAPITTTTYEYGAAGTWEAVLLKGKVVSAEGTSLRACYTYDIYGRKLSETSPRANLSACP